MLKTILTRLRGIGLLELMLSLAIIAILLIMATRYYQSASTNQKINQAVDMFGAIHGAASNFYHSQAQTGTYATSISELVSAGYLPASYLDSGASTANVSSPWNTLISVNGSGGFINVSMSVPNGNLCAQLYNRLQSTLSTATGDNFESTCDASGGAQTLQVNYVLN